MIPDMLMQIKNRMSQEVQFRLGHLTLIKINNEWTEFDSQILSLSDWEDLKDYCLQNNEKVLLETKGFVKSVFSDPNQTWVYSFTEWKDCLRAHFTLIQKTNAAMSQIQFAPYFDSLKKKSGLHIISGQKHNGKSSLLSEIIAESRKHSPQLIAIHAPPSQLTLTDLDSVVHFGMESISWEPQHPIYDGIDTLVVDANEIQHLNKWVRFAEEGRTVLLSLSASSIENVLLQVQSLTHSQQSLWFRFCFQLESVIFQKVASGFQCAVHEIWTLKNQDQKKLTTYNLNEKLVDLITDKNLYQSLNQSILQSLVRRRIDVKKAFSLSNDIENLDQNLKKLGL